MKTIIILSNPWRKKTFIVNGHPSDVSDKIVRIKRAIKCKATHGVQSIS